MSLVDKIAANRRREARYNRAEKVLRRVRQRIFDYEDESPTKFAKARRIIAICKRILGPKWIARRKAREARILEETPSRFEPGLCGRPPENL